MPTKPNDRRGAVRIPGDAWDKFNAWFDEKTPGLTKEHVWGNLAEMIVELDDATALMTMVKMGEPADRAAFARLVLERIAEEDGPAPFKLNDPDAPSPPGQPSRAAGKKPPGK